MSTAHLLILKYNIENIISLPGELSGTLANCRTIRKELVPMITYNDLFTFVIMLCAVITLVSSIFKRKK